MTAFEILHRKARPVRPEVSIVLPVYNAGPELAGTLERISSMSSGRVEVLIVDDGSTDADTAHILQHSIHLFDELTLVRLDSNQGVASARNVGISLARGEFLWFVDWDDDWDADILDVMLARARQVDADIVVVKALHTGFLNGRRDRLVDGLETGQVFDGAEGLRMMLEGRLRGYLWSKLIARELIADKCFPPLSSMSDFGGLVGIVSSAKRIAFVPGDPKYRHLVRPDSITNARAPKLENMYAVRDILFEEVASRGDVSLGRSGSLLTRFSYQFCNLPAVDTALRLGVPNREFDRVLRRARREMDWAGVAQLGRRSPVVAVRAGIVLLLGRGYRPFYMTFTEARRAVLGASRWIAGRARGASWSS